MQSIQIEAEVSVTQRSAHEMYPFEMKITRTRLFPCSGVVVRGIAVRNDNSDTQTDPWIPHILFFHTDTVTNEAYGRTDGQLLHWLWIVTTPRPCRFEQHLFLISFHFHFHFHHGVHAC